MRWEGVVENLLSNFISAIMVFAVAWVIFIYTKRSRLLRFFGINNERRLVIYLSNLKMLPGDTFGIDNLRRSYTGSAVAFGEMQSASHFRDLLNYFLPSLSENQSFLSKLLISDIQIQMKLSPSNPGQVEQSASFITLGSPAYNNASRFAEETLHSMARFGLGKANFLLPNEPEKFMGIPNTNDSPSPYYTGTVIQEEPHFESSGSIAAISDDSLQSGNKKHKKRSALVEPVTPIESPPSIIVENIQPFTEETYGFIERALDDERKRSVFYVAGLSELATVGAANFLISHWGELHRKYGDNKRFLVMLRFEPTDFKQGTVVFEK